MMCSWSRRSRGLCPVPKSPPIPDCRVIFCHPFVSSNVDTVTESSMAIIMAKLGGIGIIHRFMTIERQGRGQPGEAFRRIRHGQSVYPHSSSNPFEAKLLMKRHGVTSAIIVDPQNKILGLVSERDTWFLHGKNPTMQSIMTPVDKLITASVATTLREAREIFRTHRSKSYRYSS